MAKISRPVVYAAVLGVAAYAVVLLTEPDAPKKKPAIRIAASAAEAPKGFLKEDLTANFARYKGSKNDAFRPKAVSRRSQVVTAKAAVADTRALTPNAGGVWILTGIASVNGVLSALVENAAADQVIFLKAGETWNTLKVTAIEPDAVILVNLQGKKTRISFPLVAEEKPAGRAGPIAPVTSAPAAPSVPQVAPMPVPPLPGLTPGTGVRF